MRAVDLCVVRAGRDLLRSISLTVVPGKVVCIVGPNGAGKTTLLRAFAGDFAPTRGAVELDGRAIHAWNARDLALRRAVVRQQVAVAFDPLVRDVVQLGGIARGGWRGSSSDEASAVRALKRVGLEGFAGRRFSTLSGGEQQRAHAARALLQLEEPSSLPRAAAQLAPKVGREKYLLLDEPTSSLDPRHQHEVLGLVRSLADSGVGVLCVLHDLQLALVYGDEVVAMKDGIVAAHGSPDDVMTPALLEDLYGVRSRRCDAGDDDRGVIVMGL